MVHGNVYRFPKNLEIKWPSLVQILWSFEVETLLNPLLELLLLM